MPRGHTNPTVSAYFQLPSLATPVPPSSSQNTAKSAALLSEGQEEEEEDLFRVESSMCLASSRGYAEKAGDPKLLKAASLPQYHPVSAGWLTLRREVYRFSILFLCVRVFHSAPVCM